MHCSSRMGLLRGRIWLLLWCLQWVKNRSVLWRTSAPSRYHAAAKISGFWRSYWMFWLLKNIYQMVSLRSSFLLACNCSGNHRWCTIHIWNCCPGVPFSVCIGLALFSSGKFYPIRTICFILFISTIPSLAICSICSTTACLSLSPTMATHPFMHEIMKKALV